jgi:hypothetical protein
VRSDVRRRRPVPPSGTTPQISDQSGRLAGVLPRHPLARGSGGNSACSRRA